MRGPTNRGSESVDKSRDWPGFDRLTGEAGAELGTDDGSIPSQLGPVDFELGVIAGTRTFNFITSAFLPNPDDGKVTVESTKVAGMRDFLIVEHSHHFMIRTDWVIRNTVAFLRTGVFLDSENSDEE